MKGKAGFLLWLRQDQPAIYAQLRATVPEVAQFESLWREVEAGEMQGLGWLQQTMSAIGNVAKNAWTKVLANMPKIINGALEIGGQVYAAKQQKKLIDSQIKQAEAGQAPLSTGIDPGQQMLVPTYTGGTAAQPLVYATQKQEIIPGIPDVVTYVGVGALGLLVLKKLGVL